MNKGFQTQEEFDIFIQEGIDSGISKQPASEFHAELRRKLKAFDKALKIKNSPDDQTPDSSSHPAPY